VPGDLVPRLPNRRSGDIAGSFIELGCYPGNRPPHKELPILAAPHAVLRALSPELPSYRSGF